MNRPDPAAYDSKAETLTDHYRAESTASHLVEPATPTETFLADLRSIHAVDPRQAVADLAHDTATEGYARRPFRTNPHD